MFIYIKHLNADTRNYLCLLPVIIYYNQMESMFIMRINWKIGRLTLGIVMGMCTHRGSWVWVSVGMGRGLDSMTHT